VSRSDHERRKKGRRGSEAGDESQFIVAGSPFNKLGESVGAKRHGEAAEDEGQPVPERDQHEREWDAYN
jgi:hypothetical protein